MRPEDNLVLVGPRGAGKSTLARELARRLRRACVDLDDELAARAGKSADLVLVEDGEPAFRVLERQILEEWAGRRGLVVATGGGAVLHAEAFARLAASGTVVYLELPVAELVARAARRPRPPLTALPAGEEIPSLLRQRADLYLAAADIVVRADGPEPILAVLSALAEETVAGPNAEGPGLVDRWTATGEQDDACTRPRDAPPG